MRIYALAIFTGAFLLFLIQPIVAKSILPWFGGSTSVWTTCMLFFQSFLLLGYCYAHAISRWLSTFWQAALHFGAVGVSLLFLPITPGAEWRPSPSDEPILHILSLLVGVTGLPYLVLAATGPLVQHWCSVTEAGRSPYRLYAMSNLGSLLALLSYPFVLEPLATSSIHGSIWSVGLLVYFLLIGVCTARFWGRRKLGDDHVAGRRDHPGSDGHANWATKVLWLGFAACASALLLGVTNMLCQNVAVVPFLWILPLGVYLLTFVICFDRPAWYRRGGFTVTLLALVALYCSGLVPRVSVHWQIAFYAALLLVSCLVCHGELYRLKPAVRHLTLFYLIIALGGAMGGFFVALLAPLMFVTLAELNWAFFILGALLTAIHMKEKTPSGRLSRVSPRIWPVIAAFTVVFAAVQSHVAWRRSNDTAHRVRSFFGTHRVDEVAPENPDLHGRLLFHGSILHGAQFLHPAKSRAPLTYYGPESGVGLAIAHLPDERGVHVGIVGLGVGTLAAYGQGGDRFRFYEIDPHVRQIALESFTYLEDSRAAIEVVLGDARLSMEHEPDQGFDLLVLDAFSGDAPPVHLLTREAFEIYLRHLKPDGVIAVHITNQHVDYYPVLRAMVEHFGMEMALIPTEKELMPTYLPSDWILMTRSKSFLRSQAITSRARPPKDPKSSTPIAWTDDHASLLRILKRSAKRD